MNKKMIFAAIAAIATMSGIVGFNTQQQGSNISALTLANVEALSTTDDNHDGIKYHLQPCSHSTANECVIADREYDCYSLRHCD